MAGLRRASLLVAAVLWAVVIVATAAHKSGDFVLSLEPSVRLLAGAPPYAAPPPEGWWWPPFTAAILAPFALLARASLPLAKAAWALAGIACAGWSVAAIGRRWGWLPALLPVVVLARALHNNFEHGQITAILVACVVAAIVELDRGREIRAGAWIGVAAAAKAFPGLLLLYLALARRWRGLAAGVAVAGALTVGAMLPYGPVDAATTAWTWFARSLSAPGTEGLGMQKLGRLAFDVGAPGAALAAAHVALLAALAATLLRRRPPRDALYDVGLVTLLAVLVSPIGWFYYFGLLLPAGAAAVVHAPRPGDRGRRVWLAAVWAAAVLLSGWLRLIPFPAPLAFVTRNNDTIGALLLFMALVALRWRRAPSLPEPV